MDDDRNMPREGEDPTSHTTEEELQHKADQQQEAENVLEASALADELTAEMPPKKSIGREVLEWVLVIVVAVAAALVIRTFIFEPVRVDGNSMLNTLHDKEYMIVTKHQYLFGDPDRFDVVICHYPDRGSTNFVKRVVGIPGDTVAMIDGNLYVNGEMIDEPHIDYKANYAMPEMLVEEGHYFVLGDNRSNSNDSHAPGVGQLTRDQIIGKVRLVAWPISAWRTIQ